MTPDDHAAEQAEIADARVKIKRNEAAIAQRDGFTADAARLTSEAARMARPKPTGPPRRARARGAGRPARRAAARSSAASGDSGDSDSDEPAGGGLPVHVVGTAGDRAAGDAAVARAFEGILAAQRPGTTWSVAP